MPINTREVLALVTQVCEQENLRVALQESAKGGLIAGGTTMLGGLLGGPIGLAIGGTVGGLTAAWLSHGKFKSVATIIQHDLTPAQRTRLADTVRAFLQSRSVEDVAKASQLLLNPSLKLVLLQTVLQFIISALIIVFQKKQKNDSPSSMQLGNNI